MNAVLSFFQLPLVSHVRLVNPAVILLFCIIPMMIRGPLPSTNLWKSELETPSLDDLKTRVAFLYCEGICAAIQFLEVVFKNVDSWKKSVLFTAEVGASMLTGAFSCMLDDT